MTRCPIFQTFRAAKLVSSELNSLWEEIPKRLKNEAPDLFNKALNEDEDDIITEETTGWAYLGATCLVPVSLREKGARGRARDRKLSLRYDLYRELSDDHPVWKHASDALLVIGYWPSKDEYWGNEEMVVTAGGRLKDEAAWKGCKTNRQADGRLLEWAEIAEGKNWSQRSWIFAVPIRSIRDPDSVGKQIVEPVINLLVKDKDPKVALSGTEAVTWSQT